MTDTFLQEAIADLQELTKRLDCSHRFIITHGRRDCRDCTYGYDTCITCDMPSVDGECDWCDK